MGTFLSITFELRYAKSFENNIKQIKVVRYISDNLGDMAWQESIAAKLRRTTAHHTTISIILRLFDEKDIEKGKLKSYARYMKKEDKLVIDQMLVLNDYLDLQEDEMRRKLCDEIFSYLKMLLIKYKDRFLDFDSVAFIPLLENRMERIKNNEFEDDFYESQMYAIQKRARESELKTKTELLKDYKKTHGELPPGNKTSH